jgi:predicted RNase H-like nuclease (RuvC/YqgF family)
MHDFAEENKKRMAFYKAQEESKQAHDLVDELSKRVANLQSANIRLFNEAASQKRLNAELMSRLSRLNDPVDSKGYTQEDLKFLKALGIQA